MKTHVASRLLEAAACLLIGLSPWTARSAAAPVPDADPNVPAMHMCGDGTTFTVTLPDLENPGREDAITLPNGCRIYALFVSGYGTNAAGDELLFYRAAKFVMENGGYVHWSWWNNLLKEYLGGPLHRADSHPGTGDLLGFLPDNIVDWARKAVPDEDYQFQADALRMLAAIRKHNPDAIVIVAGHSMGGGAVARLGMSPDAALIDLLAPIDPVGNRSSPVGDLGSPEFSWTRWRAIHDFRGYRVVDCVRDPANGWCRDFRQNWWEVPQFACVATGSLLSNPPLWPASNAFPMCVGPVKYWSRPDIGANVARLYHRWQKEAIYPFDYLADYEFARDPSHPLDLGSVTGSRNYQRAFERNNPFINIPDGEGNREKLCSLGRDPRAPGLPCYPNDGHGEIIGYRGDVFPPWISPEPYGTRARDWAGDRRALLLEMVAAGPEWAHAPLAPQLCLVSEDLMRIISTILAEKPPGPERDLSAPVTLATTNPGANDAGWHDDASVEVTLTSTDAGSGVVRQEYLLSGAHVGWYVTVPGAPSAKLASSATLEAEGVTTLAYSARDAAGNVEEERSLAVKIDRTPPGLGALVSPPLVEGWSTVDALVTFQATDALSGVAAVSEPVSVTSEGPPRPITGSAVDYAGNQASTQTMVGIDRTAPSVTIDVPADGAAYPLNAGVTSAYGCADGLSGLRACAGPVPSGAPLDTSRVGPKWFTVSAADVAGNGATHAHAYSIAYVFPGFLRPLEALPAVNVAKGGSTVPIKWTLRDGSGAAILDLATLVSAGSAATSCDAGQPAGALEPVASPGGTALRISEDQYTLNWKTSAAWTGCRVLELRLLDGSTHRLAFRFR